MIEALRSEGVSSAAVVTPYLAPVNDGLRNYLASSGITVETLDSFYCKTTAELGQIAEEQVLELALRTVTSQSESLFLACSQLPTLNTVAKLARPTRHPGLVVYPGHGLGGRGCADRARLAGPVIERRRSGLTETP